LFYVVILSEEDKSNDKSSNNNGNGNGVGRMLFVKFGDKGKDRAVGAVFV
jgi:hypothetical protein